MTDDPIAPLPGAPAVPPADAASVVPAGAAASGVTTTGVTPAGVAPMVQTLAELVQRRDRLRLSAADVALRLKLAPRQIEAIESGEWAALPGATFVRGALRGYGRVVGADVSALLAQVGSQDDPLRGGMSLHAPLPRRSAVRTDGTAARRRAALVRVAVLAAVLVAAFALLSNRIDDLAGVRSWLGVPTGAAPAAEANGPASADAAASATTNAGTGTDQQPSEPAGGAADGPFATPAGPGITPPPLVPNAPRSAATSGGRQ